MKEIIYLGSDHAGYEMKEDIKKYLTDLDHPVEDLGAYSDEPSDYPEFAYAVAEKIIEKKARGILFCGSGEGMAIAANRLKGARASVVWNEDIARETREDNDSNILSLPSRYLKLEEARKIVKAWLETPFSQAERHVRRIKKLEAGI